MLDDGDDGDCDDDGDDDDDDDDEVDGGDVDGDGDGDGHDEDEDEDDVGLMVMLVFSYYKRGATPTALVCLGLAARTLFVDEKGSLTQISNKVHTNAGNSRTLVVPAKPLERRLKRLPGLRVFSLP